MKSTTKPVMTGKEKTSKKINANSPHRSRLYNDHPQFLRLERAIGNRAMGQLIQAKLKVSQPDDKYEREADRIADEVMRIQVKPRLMHIQAENAKNQAMAKTETPESTEGVGTKNEEGYRKLAFSYIHYWYNAACEAVKELPDRENDLLMLLVHAGSLLWALSPLLATTPLGLALIGAAGAEMALLADTAVERHPNKEVKQDIIDNLGLLEHTFQAAKETAEFVEKVEKNYGIYNHDRVAVWHTIFPNIGFQNRTQVKQNIKASALQTIYQRAGGGVTEMAKGSEETTVAAIAEALIEFEHWSRSWGSKEPNNRDRVRHFNQTYHKIKRKFSPKAGTVGPLVGFGYGAFVVLSTDAEGRIMVNLAYQPFFKKALKIYKLTIRPMGEIRG